MTARELHVVIDAADVDVVCDFWVAALGYTRFGSFEQYRSAMPPAGERGPKLVFQQVPEPRSPAKNRLHLDLVVGDAMESEAERLVGLGASRRSDVVHEAGTAWIVMTDPEGNEFCLVHH